MVPLAVGRCIRRESEAQDTDTTTNTQSQVHLSYPARRLHYNTHWTMRDVPVVCSASAWRIRVQPVTGTVKLRISRSTAAWRSTQAALAIGGLGLGLGVGVGATLPVPVAAVATRAPSRLGT